MLSPNQGDRVKLQGSPFPANTIIGFYLVADGWKNGICVDGKYTHFTLPQFNINNYQQHTLFMEETCGDIVMTFEDITVDKSDKDFNDIIFTVSDNNTDSLAVSKIDISNFVIK